MILKVTEEDIKNGVQLNAASCALALAFKREIKPKEGDRVSVGLHTAYVLRKIMHAEGFETEDNVCTYDLPQEASLFVARFDSTRNVSPATFEVTKRAGSAEDCPE